jgi:hypothetical protein
MIKSKLLYENKNRIWSPSRRELSSLEFYRKRTDFPVLFSRRWLDEIEEQLSLLSMLTDSPTTRDARFLSVQHMYQHVEKIYHITIKFTKCPQNILNCGKIDQKAIKYTNIFHCKSLQILPKLGFLVWKYAIWQPCQQLVESFSFHLLHCNKFALVKNCKAAALRMIIT